MMLKTLAENLPVKKLALLVIALLGLGVYIDSLAEITQTQLFWAIHVAGFTGIITALSICLPKLKDNKLKILLVIGALIGWRISYFPLMVFSGHIASIGEWVLVRLPLIPSFVFPTYFMAMATLNAIMATVVWLLLKQNDLKYYAAAVLPASVAIMISFTTASDLTRLLPDSPWSQPPVLPEISLPDQNPYLPKLEKKEYNIPQRVLLFAAGNTYQFIPESPWAKVVKGVLEAETNRNPVATSRDRVIEHHVGYIKAHPFIGCKNNDYEAMLTCIAHRQRGMGQRGI